MSDGVLGYAATLVSSQSAGTVGNIQSINIAGQTRDVVDISTMASTGKFKEYIAGMADAGELTVEVNYDGTTSTVAAALQADYAGGTVGDWTITLPGTAASVFACSGLISNLGTAIPKDDKITQSITIKLSGVPSFTA